MKRSYKKKPKKDIGKAKKSISEYFSKAKEAFKSDKKKADDYVRKARKLAMKYKIRLTKPQQKKFCPHCYSFLMPGVNVRVRIQDEKLVSYCKECKKFNRIPLRKR